MSFPWLKFKTWYREEFGGGLNMLAHERESAEWGFQRGLKELALLDQQRYDELLEATCKAKAEGRRELAKEFHELMKNTNSYDLDYKTAWFDLQLKLRVEAK